MTTWFHTSLPHDLAWYVARLPDGTWSDPVVVQVVGDRLRVWLTWLSDRLPCDDRGVTMCAAYWYAVDAPSEAWAWTPFVVPEAPV